MSDDFDWARDPAIVCHEQLAVAVYRTVMAKIIIRQERANEEEFDSFILIATENAAALAAEILRHAGELAGERGDQPAAPKDPTGAERQRRRRQKLRDGHGNRA
jgi:hypothetical protein